MSAPLILLPAVPTRNADRNDTRPTQVATLIDEVVASAHFYLGHQLELEYRPDTIETLRWEVYRGRLLEPEMTRQERTFRAWQLWSVGPEGRSGVPMVAVLW